MHYDEQKLNRLKLKAEGVRQHLLTVNEEKNEALLNLRALENQRREDENLHFRSDVRMSGEEYKRRHLTKLDRQIDETRAESNRLNSDYAELSQRYTDFRALVTACEEYAEQCEAQAQQAQLAENLSTYESYTYEVNR